MCDETAAIVPGTRVPVDEGAGAVVEGGGVGLAVVPDAAAEAAIVAALASIG